MNNPNRPGGIRFRTYQPHRVGYSHSAGSSGHSLTFPFWVNIVVGFGVLALALFLLGAVFSGNPTVSGPSQPSAWNLSVPARPPDPGYYASFRVEDEKTLSVNELTFSYEHLKVVPIHPTAVHGLLALGAIEFGLDTASSDFYPTVNQSVGTAHSNGRQKPYLIYGDVSITCGPLIRNDVGLAEAIVSDDAFKSLRIHLSPEPRGPPSTTRTPLAESFRTVYVVGKINSFTGPDSFHNSFMRTRVLDLRPRAADQLNYTLAYKDWDARVDALANQYQVPSAELLASAGRRVDIEGGKVQIVTETEKERRDYYAAHPVERPRYGREYENPTDAHETYEHPEIP